MAEEASGPKEAGQGAVEGVKGKVKEKWAEVTGDDELAREAEAQQDKADAKADAAAKEAEAEKARAKATAHEAEQRVHQDP
jgi:uncharacterized protein YjbJ (UPF0337 family)